MSSFDSVSIVVPVYNSANTVSLLVSRLEATLTAIGLQYEIILVNDGSRDASWAAILALMRKHKSIRGIDLMRNYGQHNALLCGIRLARHQVIVTIDDDLQNPPEEIPKLLDELKEEVDVVYGTPVEGGHGIWRNIASLTSKWVLQNAIGAKMARKISSFRAFRTQIRGAFADFHGPFVSIDVLLTWGTSRFSSVCVRHEARQEGPSNYTIRLLLTHALNMITGFSTFPLRLSSLIGFAFTLFGGGVLVYVVGRYLIEGTTVRGFPFLASVIALFSGAQLFALGMIGEYMARMHFRMMDRPAYSVRSRIPDG